MKQSHAMVSVVLVSVIGVSNVMSSAQATQTKQSPQPPTCGQARQACEGSGGTFNSRDGTINPFNNTASHSCTKNGKKTTGQHRGQVSCDKKKRRHSTKPVRPGASTSAPKTPGTRSTPRRGGTISPQLPGNNVGVAVDTNRWPKFEKPRLANPKPPLKRPDLVVKDIRVVKDCKIQVVVANKGTAGVPTSTYPRAGVQLYRNNQPWGGMALVAFDQQKRLKTPGSTVHRMWFSASNLKLTAGTHTLKVVLDKERAVAESNERNNTLVKRLRCQSVGAAPRAVPGTSPRPPYSTNHSGTTSGTEMSDHGIGTAPDASSQPDLVIMGMYIYAHQLRFIVQNRGWGATPPGQSTKFSAFLGGAPERPVGGGGSSSPNSTGTTTSGTQGPAYGGGTGGGTAVEGIASRISETPLQPGHIVEERPLGIELPIHNPHNDRQRLTACINRDKNGKHQIDESNHVNNCLTKPLADLLPDLSVRITGFGLSKPDGFSVWDLIPPFEFKPTASCGSRDYLFVEVTNRGKASSMPVRVQGAIGAGRGTNGVLFKDVPAIPPGKSKSVGFCFPKTNPSRYKLGRCSKWTIRATVDPDKKLAEVREDNNRHETSAQAKKCN